MKSQIREFGPNASLTLSAMSVHLRLSVMSSTGEGCGFSASIQNVLTPAMKCGKKHRPGNNACQPANGR